MVAAARAAIESLYDALCSVTERRKVKRANGSTGFVEVVVAENLPCRLSVTNAVSARPPTQEREAVSAVSQIPTLFLAPEIIIKPGSKITVAYRGRMEEYTDSGVPSVYNSHQEILLRRFEKWA